MIGMSILADNFSGVPHVVVIGGGATGVGVARDAAQRGFRVTVIERGKLGQGTSGHFHGILHSGGRYALNDHTVAAECYSENQILRRIAPSAVVDTGGMFVALNQQETIHADSILQACAKAGIPCAQLTTQQALTAEPHLNKAVKRAFRVPDGTIDGAEVLRLNRHAATTAEVPAQFLTDHSVVKLHKNNSSSVTAVTVQNHNTGEQKDITCDYVVNAAGVWAGRIAQLAAIPIQMVFDKGTMMIFSQQYSHAVLNRCRPEDDGDLLVPQAGQSIMGTTARVIANPDDCLPTQEEADVLLREGTAMIPALAGAEVTRIYAGVRPLLANQRSATASNSRSISRSFQVFDHTHEGVANLISIVGGKVTLYRRMAEETVDLLCQKSGVNVSCQTAQTILTP